MSVRCFDLLFVDWISWIKVFTVISLLSVQLLHNEGSASEPN